MPRKSLAPLVLWLCPLLLLGCPDLANDNDDEDAGAEKAELGEECSKDSDCDRGRCASQDVCTDDCVIHSDCGCAVGTTNGDLLLGNCEVGCFDNSCAKVCKSNLECNGETECIKGDPFDACL